jgi:hypothetical protein
MDKGPLKLKNVTHFKNKLGYFYKLTSTGMAKKESTIHGFVQPKMVEYEVLKMKMCDQVISIRSRASG